MMPHQMSMMLHQMFIVRTIHMRLEGLSGSQAHILKRALYRGFM